jgi:cytochrome c553
MTSRVLKWTVRLAALFAAIVVSALLVAASGIIPIKASSGHWAVTEWFLQFSMRRSIATHSLGIDLPPLDAPWLVAKGATHYEAACRSCHGSPGQQEPRIAAAMLPPPPYLPPLIGDRDAEALFYVVKHGVKFTGMPAWPSRQRDDEVHAMVAFLLVMPTLDTDEYRELARPEASETLERATDPRLPEPLRVLAADCDRCHGPEGRGRETAAAPLLAGQKREYLVRSLSAYQRGTRHSGIMESAIDTLTPDEERALAAYYSGMPESPLGGLDDRAIGSRDDAVERGRTIARDGIPSQEVPPCQECHGPGSGPRNPAYPHLAGQYTEYLALQLEVFARGERGGSEYAHLMQPIAKRLTADQRRDVAAYYGASTNAP